MKLLIEILDEAIRERGAKHFAQSAQQGARRQGGVQGLVKSNVSSTGDGSLIVEVVEPYKS